MLLISSFDLVNNIFKIYVGAIADKRNNGVNHFYKFILTSTYLIVCSTHLSILYTENMIESHYFLSVSYAGNKSTSHLHPKRFRLLVRQTEIQVVVDIDQVHESPSY